MARLENIEWTHLRQVLEDFAIYLIDVARQNLAENKSYASGKLADSMTYAVIIKDDSFQVYIELEDYWEYVEKGRKPGKRPPIWKIMEWVMVKPVNPQPYTPSVESLSYAIQRSLRKKNGYAPPRKALEEWIQKKGIQPQSRTPSVEALSWAIATKIANRGTDPKPFFERAKNDALRRFETPIADAIREDIETYLEKQLDDFSKLFE